RDGHALDVEAAVVGRDAEQGRVGPPYGRDRERLVRLLDLQAVPAPQGLVERGVLRQHGEQVGEALLDEVGRLHAYGQAVAGAQALEQVERLAVRDAQAARDGPRRGHDAALHEVRARAQPQR